jgi:F-type H+-transporting ATPase subunit delta
VASDNKGGIAERYAMALFELAEEKGELDRVAADLRTLRAMLAESADFRRMCISPVIGLTAKGRAVAGLAKRAELSAVTTNFLGVLAHNGRLFVLSASIAAFLGLLATKRGELTAKVTSASPLADAQVAAISAALRRGLGQTVALESSVDAKLLGGLVVQVGSRMLDGSVRTKLQRLSLAMKGIG